MKKKLSIILGLLCFTVVIITFGWWNQQTEKSSFKVEDQREKIAKFKETNEIVAGWLRVEGTNIDLPLIVVSVGESDLGEEDQYAWTFAETYEGSNHPSFSSHNIRNVSKRPIVGDDTMKNFEQLMSFIYPDFVSKNQFIEYTNERGESALYRIYAVSLIPDDQRQTHEDQYTKEQQKAYIEKALNDSMYDMDVDVKSTDKLLTLITCTRFYGNGVIYSFKVEARKVRDREKKTLKSVKTNANYKEIEKAMKGDEQGEV